MTDLNAPALSIYSNIRPKFWENHTLAELSDAEWEALCDGCGVCCLVKFLDDDDPKFTEYTDVACQLLNCQTGQCRDYTNRQKIVPDCIRLTLTLLKDMMWLPSHCAYKRLYLGQSLPSWHRLIGDERTHQQGIKKVGVAGRCISETQMSEQEIEDRVVRWVMI